MDELKSEVEHGKVRSNHEPQPSDSTSRATGRTDGDGPGEHLPGGDSPDAESGRLRGESMALDRSQRKSGDARDGQDHPTEIPPEVISLLPESEAAVLRSVSYQRKAPLPVVSEFAGYEDVLPGAADRILTMAERAQEAHIESERTTARAASRAYTLATIATSFLPWLLVVSTVVLFYSGAEQAAVATSVLAGLAVTPGVVIKIKNAFNRNSESRDRDPLDDV